MKITIFTPFFTLMIMLFYGLAQAASAEDLPSKRVNQYRSLGQHSLRDALVKHLGKKEAKPYVRVVARVLPWVQEEGHRSNETIAEALASLKLETLEDSLDKLEPLLKAQPLGPTDFSNLVGHLNMLGDDWGNVMQKLAYLVKTLQVQDTQMGYGMIRLSDQVFLSRGDEWDENVSRVLSVFKSFKTEHKTCEALDAATLLEACSKVEGDKWDIVLKRSIPFLKKAEYQWEAHLLITDIGQLSQEEWIKAEQPLKEMLKTVEKGSLIDKVSEICAAVKKSA